MKRKNSERVQADRSSKKEARGTSKDNAKVDLKAKTIRLNGVEYPQPSLESLDVSGMFSNYLLTGRLYEPTIKALSGPKKTSRKLPASPSTVELVLAAAKKEMAGFNLKSAGKKWLHRGRWNLSQVAKHLYQYRSDLFPGLRIQLRTVRNILSVNIGRLPKPKVAN